MKTLGSHNKTTWGLGVANKRMFQVWIEMNGVSKTAHEWAEELNMCPKTLR